MFEIKFEIYENDWNDVKGKSMIDKDDLRALLQIKEISSSRQENMLVYINELYIELAKWVINDFNKEFIEFFYTDPVEFEDYLEIKKLNGEFFIDMPGNKFLIDKDEALVFGKELLSLIEEMFSKKGNEGIKYFKLLKESVK